MNKNEGAKTGEVKVTFRVPAGLHGRVAALAEHRHISMNKLITRLMERELQEETTGRLATGQDKILGRALDRKLEPLEAIVGEQAVTISTLARVTFALARLAHESEGATMETFDRYHEDARRDVEDAIARRASASS